MDETKGADPRFNVSATVDRAFADGADVHQVREAKTGAVAQENLREARADLAFKDQSAARQITETMAVGKVNEAQALVSARDVINAQVKALPKEVSK